MVPFRELEFMRMILLHIPAYKHLTSLIGLRWQQSLYCWGGGKWRVLFNATKSKLPSFNRHRKGSLIPLKMNDIKLPDSASFRLLWLVFTTKLDWKPYITAVQNKYHKELGLFFDRRDTLHQRPFCTSKPPLGPAWCTAPKIWDCARQLGCLDLLDKVQAR